MIKHPILKNLAILIVSPVLAGLVNAQDFFTAAELEEMGDDLSSRVGANNAAILNNIFNEGGYFGAMVHREPGPGFSESHTQWADIYFVTAGSASIITGGSITDPREDSPGEIRGTGISGGSRHRIGAGDVVHIPVDVPHYVVVGEGEAITYFILKARPE